MRWRDHDLIGACPALEQARRADAELARGESRGPLHGVPIALKDLIAVAGDPNWIRGFDYELPDHLALLCELKATEPRFFTQFEDKTNAMIDTALKGKCG